jgi:hypothetical protein
MADDQEPVDDKAPNIFPGKEGEDNLRAAGTPEPDIAEWRRDQEINMLRGGASRKDIATFFGEAAATYEPVNALASAVFEEEQANISTTGVELPADEDVNVLQAAVRGFEGSSLGNLQTLFGNAVLGRPVPPPPLGIGQEESILDQIVYNTTELLGDLPFDLAGYVVGFAGGAAVALPTAAITGPVGPAIAGHVTGGALGGQITGQGRQGYIEFRRANEGARLGPREYGAAMWAALMSDEARRVGAIERNLGAVTGPLHLLAKPISRRVGKHLSKPVVNRAVTGAIVTTAEISAAIGTIAVMEREIPAFEDFITAAGSIVSLKLSQAALRRSGRGRRRAKESVDTALTRHQDNLTTKRIIRNLEDNYVRTGEKPTDALRRAEADPEFMQQLITGHDKVSATSEDITVKHTDWVEDTAVGEKGFDAEEKLSIQTDDMGDGRVNKVSTEAEPVGKMVEAARPKTVTEGIDYDKASPERAAEHLVKQHDEHQGNLGQPTEADITVIEKFTEDHTKLTPAENAHLAEFVGRVSLDEATVVFRGIAAGTKTRLAKGGKGEGVVSTSRDLSIAQGFGRTLSDAKPGDGKVIPIQRIEIEAGVSAADLAKLGTRDAEGEVILRAEDTANAEATGSKELVVKGDITFEIETFRLKKGPSQELTHAQALARMDRDMGLEPPKPPKPPVTGEGGEPPRKPPKEIRDLDADVRKILSQVREDERRKHTWTDIRYETINDLEYIVAAVDTATRAETGQRRRVKLEDNVGTHMELAQGAHGIADFDINKGIVDPETGDLLSPGLRQIMKPIKKKDHAFFGAYLIAKRVLEKEAQGIKTGFDGFAARGTATRGDARPDFVKASNEIQHWQDSGIRVLVESGIMSKSRAEQVIKLNMDYVPFMRVMYDIPSANGSRARGLPVRNPVKRMSGGIRPIVNPFTSMVNNRFALRQMSENNKALQMLLDFNETLSEKNRIIERVGEVRAPKDKVTDLPIDEEISSKQVRPAEEVLTGEMRSWLDENGMDAKDAPEFFSYFSDSKALRADEFIVYQDGVAVKYRALDQNMVKSIRGMSPGEASLVAKILAKPATVLRHGVTSDPMFILRQVVRDSVGARIMNPFPTVPFVDTAVGVFRELTSAKVVNRWVANGGANSAMVEADIILRHSNPMLNLGPEPKTRAEKLKHSSAALTKVGWNVVSSPWTAMHYLAVLQDHATRIGQFERAERAGISPKEAALRARIGTLNFARMGARMRSYNRLVTFLAATVNGVDRTVTSFRDHPIDTTVKAVAWVTVPTLVLYALQGGEDWYQNIPDAEKAILTPIGIGTPPTNKDLARLADPATPQKERARLQKIVDNFYIVRIPKPQVYGQLFGYLPEKLLDTYLRDNPQERGAVVENILRGVLINPTPTGLAPVLEIGMNHNNFTGRPLVSQYNEGLVPEHRYTTNTTETSKALAKLLAPYAGVIPDRFRTAIAFEHLLGSWTGPTGEFAYDIFDATLRKIGLVDDPVLPEIMARDLPLVGSLFSRFPNISKQLGIMTDNFNRADQIQNTFKALTSQGKIAEAEELAAKHRVEFVRTAAMRKSVTTMYNIVRAIHSDPEMTSVEKRQQIDMVYAAMIDMAGKYNLMWHQLEDLE